MPTAHLAPQHDVALNALERVEYLSLAWGYVDGSLSEQEADTIVATALEISGIGVDPAQVIDELVSARLLRRWRDPEPRYRSRFAELLRLLVRSRQLFDTRPWRSSPTLVSDFRIDIRQRATPRPDVPSLGALDEISALTSLSRLQREVWLAITPAAPGSGLRRFQVEAARRLLSLPPEHGTIVTAGTGSGKTLAFYLPAIVAAAEGLTTGNYWTRALCLYPRQELLKDQLTEAHRMCRRAAEPLAKAGRRNLTLGALYSGTPRQPSAPELANVGWKKAPGGFICPFLRCPNCTSEMFWADNDISRGIERLKCMSPSCSATTPNGSVKLTRSSISNEPPDLLFTTTEMLNQRLSDTWSRHIFGIGTPRANRPLFVLLDEVHTYSGTSGAQAALLLRRWRHLLDVPVKWVGLSATLREAPQFFADLSGLRADQVSEVTPQAADMEFWGAEYQVLLRTDPSSQAATLSTSIQASMLIARMLDPTPDGPSDGRFGRRLFAFTDELDVTHRLFDDLRDAEAYNYFGRPNPNRSPLAFLRASVGADAEEREADGQRWVLAETLRGGSLQNRLVVGRTTSRDPGVDGTADVIVATAALEVGFNDPDVGAVLQHKAPRSFSAYLQRRGRAGRRAGMRPVSVTVLSDYGRDRIAFQSYEHLFDPIVERQVLPTRNAFVLRMQAVYATFDWVAARISATGTKGWAWDVLSRPSSAQSPSSARFRDAAKAIVQQIVRLEDSTIQDLSRYLRGALNLTDDELRPVLWEPPRSLLLESMPTLARRLFRDWRLANGAGLDRIVPYHPLPDFVPRSLFEDLNLPEVTIDVPAATVSDAPKEEAMPVLQALNQFAPGRVRRRFADERGGLSHWIPIGTMLERARISIADYATEREHLGIFLGDVGGLEQEIAVYRPARLQLSKTDTSILPTSHGSWHWQSQFEFIGDPLTIALPERSPWATTIPNIKFFLHRFSSAVSQLRFAAEGHAEVRTRHSSKLVRYSLQDEAGDNDIDRPAAVGFQSESDALRVDFQLPDVAALATLNVPSDIQRWLRFLYLRRTIELDDQLPQDINYFHRGWLLQIIQLAAMYRAENDRVTFSAALAAIGSEPDVATLRRASKALISGAVLDEDEEGSSSRLEDTLAEVLEKPDVIPRLAALAISTISLAGDAWGEWIASVLKNTLSEAILQACFLAAPANTALTGLTTDLTQSDSVPTAVVAEVTVGGGGTMEAIAQAFSEEPRAFLRSLDAALARSDQEETAESLESVLKLSQRDGNVAAALAALRAADSTDARMAARDHFFSLVAQHGIPPSHSLQVSVATRLLRPGASADTDGLTIELVNHWHALEEQHGIAIPMRVAAALCASVPALQARLVEIVAGTGSAISTAQLLLWPRDGEVRLSALQSHNPFRLAAVSDSATARAVLVDGRVPTIHLGEPNWQRRLSIELGAGGQVRLAAEADQEAELRAAAVRLLASPIETDYLRLYPVIEGLRRTPEGGHALDLSVRERT